MINILAPSLDNKCLEVEQLNEKLKQAIYGVPESCSSPDTAACLMGLKGKIIYVQNQRNAEPKLAIVYNVLNDNGKLTATYKDSDAVTEAGKVADDAKKFYEGVVNIINEGCEDVGTKILEIANKIRLVQRTTENINAVKPEEKKRSGKTPKGAHVATPTGKTPGKVPQRTGHIVPE